MIAAVALLACTTSGGPPGDPPIDAPESTQRDTGDDGVPVPWLVRWWCCAGQIADLVFLSDGTTWLSAALGDVLEVEEEAWAPIPTGAQWPNLIAGVGDDVFLVTTNYAIEAWTKDGSWELPYAAWTWESVEPTYCSFGNLHALARDDQGTVYVASKTWHTIWRLDDDGVARVVAGEGRCEGTKFYRGGYSGDGGPAVGAELDFGESPGEITIAGHWLYIADQGNNVVRRVDLDRGTIELFAGIPGPVLPDTPIGVEGRHRLETVLKYPTDVAVGPDGSVYITENFCVRRVDPEGLVWTVAGQCGQLLWDFDEQDGPASESRILFPSGLAFDAAGSLYIADYQQVWLLTEPR
jgi:outer membrane protein assembly factor BamB